MGLKDQQCDVQPVCLREGIDNLIISQPSRPHARDRHFTRIEKRGRFANKHRSLIVRRLLGVGHGPFTQIGHGTTRKGENNIAAIIKSQPLGDSNGGTQRILIQPDIPILTGLIRGGIGYEHVKPCHHQIKPLISPGGWLFRQIKKGKTRNTRIVCEGHFYELKRLICEAQPQGSAGVQHRGEIVVVPTVLQRFGHGGDGCVKPIITHPSSPVQQIAAGQSGGDICAHRQILSCAIATFVYCAHRVRITGAGIFILGRLQGQIKRAPVKGKGFDRGQRRCHAGCGARQQDHIIRSNSVTGNGAPRQKGRFARGL